MSEDYTEVAWQTYKEGLLKDGSLCRETRISRLIWIGALIQGMQITKAREHLQQVILAGENDLALRALIIVCEKMLLLGEYYEQGDLCDFEELVDDLNEVARWALDEVGDEESIRGQIAHAVRVTNIEIVGIIEDAIQERNYLYFWVDTDNFYVRPIEFVQPFAVGELPTSFVAAVYSDPKGLNSPPPHKEFNIGDLKGLRTRDTVDFENYLRFISEPSIELGW
jgi:hypothetical protein